MNINDIFDNIPRVGPRSKLRRYDVGVSINRSHEGHPSVRFGFLNNANKAFRERNYIQFSNIEKFPERIYFRLHDSKAYSDTYKLSKHNAASLEAKFQATPEQIKLYTERFVGRHNLRFDGTCQLYYIEALDK